ncbi:MAG: hypothetical protein M3A24_01015 [Candidatus Rhabdochlamydia oedothoracis]|nr:hypothetical protein [Candidatus Rhabdochlamydia oedothoracis]
MSSVMLNAACSFFDVKNIEESRLPSKTGAVRFLAVSALVASVFASALIPAAICTGVIAATTAAIMLKNRQVEQLNENEVVNGLKDERQVEQSNENEVVNGFKDAINNYTEEKKCGLLTACLSCLTEKTKEMPEEVKKSKKFLFFSWSSPKATKMYLVKDLQKYLKTLDADLVERKKKNQITIKLTEAQRKIKELSVVSTLSIIEHLYVQLDKPQKAQETANFIEQIQSD